MRAGCGSVAQRLTSPPTSRLTVQSKGCREFGAGEPFRIIQDREHFQPEAETGIALSRAGKFAYCGYPVCGGPKIFATSAELRTGRARAAIDWLSGPRPPVSEPSAGTTKPESGSTQARQSRSVSV